VAVVSEGSFRERVLDCIFERECSSGIDRCAEFRRIEISQRSLVAFTLVRQKSDTELALDRLDRAPQVPSFLNVATPCCRARGRMVGHSLRRPQNADRPE
jgi:hypothetical protein